MTNLDRLYFFYRAPRERFRQLLAIYGRKPEDRLPDARTFLTRFAAHKSNYLLGFITDPVTALFLIAWDISALRTNVFAALGSFCFGLLTWTLLEYGFHRFVYHKGNTLAHKGHLMHHESPRLLLGMPWYVTSGFFLLMGYIFAVGLRVPAAASFFGAIAAGYFYYCSVHHIQHHFRLANTWFRGLTRHHNIHHRLQDVNFGVTNRFWDRVFGTQYRKEDYKLRKSEPPAVAGG